MARLDLPPIWLLGMIILATVLHYFWPILPFSGGYLAILAGILCLGGVALILVAARHFRAQETTIHPGGKPTSLIIAGPYRLSRNPIYLSLAMILTGVAIWLGSLLPLLVVVLFVTVITRRFIEPEEARLREAFGAEAEEYINKTRRWI